MISIKKTTIIWLWFGHVKKINISPKCLTDQYNSISDFSVAPPNPSDGKGIRIGILFHRLAYYGTRQNSTIFFFKFRHLTHPLALQHTVFEISWTPKHVMSCYMYCIIISIRPRHEPGSWMWGGVFVWKRAPWKEKNKLEAKRAKEKDCESMNLFAEHFGGGKLLGWIRFNRSW